MNYLIAIVLIAAAVFVGMRFVAANNAQKAVTAINLGRTAALKKLSVFLTQDTPEDQLKSGWEGALQRFFLAFSASQYADCCARNKLKAVPAEKLTPWLENEAGRLSGMTSGPEDPAARQQLDEAARTLAQRIAALPETQLGEENCVFGLAEQTAGQILPFIYTQSTAPQFARELTVALAECSKAVCEQVAGSAAGGRHFGGGCC